MDCPGIVFAKARNAEEEADVMLRNCLRVEQMSDPAIAIGAILRRVSKEQLLKHYGTARLGLGLGSGSGSGLGLGLGLAHPNPPTPTPTPTPNRTPNPNQLQRCRGVPHPRRPEARRPAQGRGA